MEVINGKEFYTIGEVSEILELNIGRLYHRIKNFPEFPESKIINGFNHWTEDQFHKIEEITNRKLDMGASRQTRYIPKQHNSYSKLKIENQSLLKENVELKKQLGRKL